jgi:hypothetical protein
LAGRWSVGGLLNGVRTPPSFGYRLGEPGVDRMWQTTKPGPGDEQCRHEEWVGGEFDDPHLAARAATADDDAGN